ncbi:MAG: autotransporter-associated beta strand repeat-containing protein [Thermoguttaceae bacterium]
MVKLTGNQRAEGPAVHPGSYEGCSRRLANRCRVGAHKAKWIPALRTILTLTPVILGLVVALWGGAAARAETAPSEPPTKTREIYVPVSDLKVLLESEPHRVLLTRQEYDELVKKAKKTPETHVPHLTAAVSSDYDITIDDGRAKLHGTIVIDVMEDGLHAIPLDFGGVGLLAAKLDDQSAPIGFAPGGRLNLLVSGQGRHQLTLDMIAPLEMNSAQQHLSFRLTNAPVGRCRLTVPGDVEIKGGADVVSRAVDEAAKITRFELLPCRGDTTIRMSLNSHLQRREQAVASRCVLFDEVTEAYEKLHATVTFWILHRAVDRFRFVVPEGFEITEINSPLLARWDIETEPGRKVVNVRLREQTTDTVVLSVAAIKTPSQLKPWRMPRLEPLDVVGQVTVLGLLVQDQLKAESLTANDLIAVDTGVLATALPATLVRPEPGAVPLRYIAAYYAPQGRYELKADISRPPTTLAVTTNVLLNIGEKGCEVRGGFALLPTGQKRFAFDFSVPAGWSVIEVTGPDKSPLAIERYTNEKQPGRVRVKLPQGIAPGQIYVASFRAQSTPPGWLSPWKSQTLEFPMFRVADAQRDEGAVAVAAEEDLRVQPEKVDGLVPITEAEMARFGLTTGATNLAYRCKGSGGKATIGVDRTKSRATARTFAFFQIVPEVLKAHYVAIYTIEDAKTRRLALLLPDSTPEALTIAGLDGVSVKEFSSEPAGTMRRWNVLLGEARRGEVRLAIDFQMRPQMVGETSSRDGKTISPTEPAKQESAAAKPEAAGKVTELKNFALPLLQADAVAYQSGLVAIESDLELGVDVKTDARRADVGQLAIAKYTPASLEPNQEQQGNRGPKQRPMRFLGTYDFVGKTPKVAVDVYRNPNYALTPAIVQRAKLTSLVSADGTSQTQATFQLYTKAPYLEVELPKGSSLWSAVLDGTPLKPQKRDESRLLGLPPAASGAVRSLQVVYEAPVQSLTNGHRVSLTAPRLSYRASRDAKKPTEIPLVNIEWTVTVPDGYEAVATNGTLEAKPIERPLPAPLVVAGALYELGGAYQSLGVPFAMREAAKSASKNNVRQWGMATGEAKPASSFASPSLKAAESQDNMVGELVVQDKEKDVRQKPAGAFHSVLEAGKAEPEAMARPVVGTVAAPAGAPAPPMPPAPAAPPGPAGAEPASTLLSNAINPGVDSTSAPVPALVPGTSPSATTPPEPGKPAEGQPSGGFEFAGNGPGPNLSKRGYQKENLLGFRSLKIDVQSTPRDERQLLTFSSLGADPQIEITFARRNRNTVLVWGLALAVFVLGVAITGRPVGQKVALVLGIALASALLPLAWDTVNFARICNGIFYAASLLVPYYLAAGLIRWILHGLHGLVGRFARPAPAPVITALVLLTATLFASTVQARPQPAAPEPVAVPGDAIIVPYDVKSKTGVQDADHLLVPYDRYVELWNRAYPDKKIDAHPAPLPYALSAAAYSAVLAGEETLNLTGQMQINVLTEGYVSIPFGLRGGVLARADLDGKPARLKVVSAEPGQAGLGKGGKAPMAMDATLLLLQVSGKGTHKLTLEIRLKLGHVGGWRGTIGSLPTAPAATVTFRVPQPQTEVRLGLAIDRRIRETQRPDETLETALGPGGALQLQWRPKVAEGQVDRGLTVETASLLDIEEDGLRMSQHIKLEFRRSQRDAFTLSLPLDYLVEKVAGSNVRGWEVRRGTNEQTVEVSLLKTAKDTEQFNLFLSQSGKVGQAPLDTFAVPMVTVRDAALSSGELTIRRSPLLDVRTTERSGVSRIDLGPPPDLSGGPATEESVLAIRPYEAYHFPTTPFVLRLSAAPTVAEVTAEAQTSVKLDPSEPGLESKIVFHVGQRRVYRFEVAVPDDLRLPEVTLPSGGIWSIEKEESQSILRIHLQQGVLGDSAVILRGKLAAFDTQKEIALPRLEVLGAKRQEGDIAVQADPAFNVQSRELHDCQETELERIAAWLDPQLRSATRLALHYASGAYAGKLRLVSRTPEVACDTVTNVRVTDRAIEETIFLNYSILNAGIHELTFLLPASMADARISTPMLRRRTMIPVDPKVPDSPLRVRLELQGDVMNDLRVLVENDRLLTPGSHTVPLPGFEASAGHGADSVRHQYAVLETTNRDELVVEPLVEMDALSRQQQQWQALSTLLDSKRLYQAYLIQPGAVGPRLSFHLQRHEDVETAGARIDLAQTTIVVDVNGAYRAKLELSLDNSSEQFIDVELPDGAALWTVHVAGEPVKPAQLPGASDFRHVLLPVRKTAKGDVNYLVALKYGGKMASPSPLSNVQFPLVRNVRSYPGTGNIGIEQSQVEIYVPKSHQWFAFGGTMHAAEDEADLKAGRIAAFNKQGQRLIEAAHDKDPFARVRASENLKNWVAEAQRNQNAAGRVANKALESQIVASFNTAQQAQDVLKSSPEGKPQDGEATVDNRERLNDLYQKQAVVNANGTLAFTGNNSYSGGTIINEGELAAQNPADFNGNWIMRNNLKNDFAIAQQAAQPNGPAAYGSAPQGFGNPQDGVRYSPPAAQPGLAAQGAGNLALSRANAYSGPTAIAGEMVQNANPNFAGGRIILNNDQAFGGQGNVANANPFAYSSAGSGMGGMGGMDRKGGGDQGGPLQAPAQSQMAVPRAPTQQAYGRRGAARDDQQQELAEYQQKLSKGNKAGQPQAQFVEQNALDVVPSPPPASGVPFDNSVAFSPPRAEDVDVVRIVKGGAGSITTTAAPTAPTGLASLDFELPTDKNLYEVFRFTTPRGEAELTARTISNRTLTKLELLAGIVAASLMIWAGFWLIRRGALVWFRRPLGAGLLVIVGVASLCSGVLPFAALIAMLVGIGLLIAHYAGYRARRKALV